MLELTPTRAKTTYVSPDGQNRPLAMMSRAEAIEAIQELQLRFLERQADSITYRSVNSDGIPIQDGFERYVADANRRQLVDMDTGNTLILAGYPFRILASLFAARGNVVPTQKMIEYVYRDERRDEPGDADNVIKVYICRLRKELRLGGWPLEIRNRFGLGYYIYRLPGAAEAATLPESAAPLNS